MRFRDRADAGRQLGGALEQFRLAGPTVVGLARGGVIVAAEVARHLGVPLYVTVVRKLGHPAHPELGLGALAEDGAPVWNDSPVGGPAIREQDRYDVLASEREEMRRRRETYQAGLLPESLKDQIVLVVDDGLATGGTARAAVGYVRRLGAEKVVVAVPVGAQETVNMLRTEADEVVTLVSPGELYAVGQWYECFDQCSDSDVLAALTPSH